MAIDSAVQACAHPADPGTERPFASVCLGNGTVAVGAPSDERCVRWLAALSAAGIRYDVHLRGELVRQGLLATDDVQPKSNATAGERPSGGRGSGGGATTGLSGSIAETGPPRKSDAVTDCLIVLEPAMAERALEEILAYEGDNRNFPPPPPPPAEDVSDTCVMSSVVVAGLLLLAFLKTGAVGGDSFRAASAVLDSAAVRQGELWRLATALALHKDTMHLLSNSLCLLVFGSVIASRVGFGSGWLGVLVGGTLGNSLAVWLSREPFRAVGASTAVFAALGILVVLRFAHLNHWGREGGRERLSFFEQRWLPWLAGVGALALLGTASGSHLEGHLYGFLAGLGVGAGLVLLCGVRTISLLQHVLFALFLGLNVIAWKCV